MAASVNGVKYILITLRVWTIGAGAVLKSFTFHSATAPVNSNSLCIREHEIVSSMMNINIFSDVPSSNISEQRPSSCD